MKDEYSFENFQKRREEIRNRNKSNKKALSKLFLTTFGVVLCGFLLLAVLISPRLNIPTSTEPESDTTEDSSLTRVDYRLKEIQLDDSMPSSKKAQSAEHQNPLSLSSIFGHSGDLGKVELPTFEAPTLPSKNYVPKMPAMTKEKEQPKAVVQPQIPQNLPPASTTTSASASPAVTKSYKLLVGDYASPEDAKNIADLLGGVGVKSTMKTYNGSYVLQVGSYSDYNKAQNVASQYRAKNYKVRVIED